MKDLTLKKLASSGKTHEAMHKGIHLLRKHPLDKQLLRHMELLVKSVDRPDPEFMDDVAGLNFPHGRVLHIRALVASGNATEAMAMYKKLVLGPNGRNLLPAREFAKLLKDAKCHEAAELMYWRAIADQPEDMQLVQESIENLLDLAELAFPEKFSETRELAEFIYKRFPANPHALFAIAQVWYKASRMDRCLPYFREFFKLNPNHAARAGFVFNLNYDEELSREGLVEEHKSWCEKYQSLVQSKPVSLKRDKDPERKLKIGYVSPDLGMHPVGFFAIPVLVRHNPDQVETFIYSHRDSVAQHDAFSQRLQNAVGEDHWRWISKDSTSMLTSRIAEDQIDILVDLAGHSHLNRLDAFANRAAPVQVSWLGYPHSTWLPNMDYRLSDSVVEPEGEADAWSSETIYRMPNGFHALEMDSAFLEPAPPPCLKNGYITFGSFNNINKIGSRTIQLWASLLRAVPDSRLLLKHKTMQVLENREGIRSLFALEGIHPNRISFKGITRHRDHHFQAYAQMDIALDPFGYNGTTTTCEALYMGVPVLSLPGEKHASRVSASLLHRMGLDGWIAKDKKHYLRIACHAARNFDALAARRRRMRTDFLESPLADTVGLARDLEMAYRSFWKQYCEEGLPQNNAAQPATPTKDEK
ncbi:MAG: hypothetical protein AB3N63_12110 [Puniceicoccaceae bacterium]